MKAYLLTENDFSLLRERWEGRTKELKDREAVRVAAGDALPFSEVRKGLHYLLYEWIGDVTK